MPFGAVFSDQRDVDNFLALKEGVMPVGLLPAVLAGRQILDRLPAAEQPTTVYFEMVDDIAVVSTTIHKAGTYIPQHAHKHAHLSVIAAGRVAVWKNGELFGCFGTGRQIVIDADVKHMFQALVDETVVLCVHNVSRTGAIEITEKHEIV